MDNFPNDHAKRYNLEFYVKKMAEKKINLFILEFTEWNKVMNDIIKQTYNKKKISPCFVDIVSMDNIKEQETLSKHLTNYFQTFIKKTISNTIQAQNVNIIESKLNYSFDTECTADLEEKKESNEDNYVKNVYCGEELMFKFYQYDYQYSYQHLKNFFSFDKFRVSKKEEFDKGNPFKYCITDPIIGSGTFREAFIFIGVEDDNLNLNSKFICKKFIKNSNDIFLEKHQEVYLLAKLFYDHFKVYLQEHKLSLQIFYLLSSVIELNEEPQSSTQFSKGDKFQIEKMIDISKFRKFSNNSVFVSDEESYANKIAQAFSHFTYVYSNGNLIIVDIQGDSKYFTDPAIHTREQKFPPEIDRGLAGIAEFLFMHKCNSICKTLNLHSYC